MSRQMDNPLKVPHVFACVIRFCKHRMSTNVLVTSLKVFAGT